MICSSQPGECSHAWTKAESSALSMNQSKRAIGARMFWRILLLTCFATGAAWGPAFCCCRVSQLLESGVKLVGNSLQPDSPVALNSELSASGSCPRCAERKARSAAERKADSRKCCHGIFGEQTVPDSESTCPCRERGEQGSGLWAFAFADQQLERSGSLEAFAGLLSGNFVGVEPDLRMQKGSLSRLLEHPPFLLFGRALLRAFQTLNC